MTPKPSGDRRLGFLAAPPVPRPAHGWTFTDPRGAQVDVRDRAAATHAMARLRPTCVIHTAYREAGPEAFATTVRDPSTSPRLLSPRERGWCISRPTSSSTAAAERRTVRTPLRRRSPPTGRHKAEAEARARAAHPDPVVVRRSPWTARGAPAVAPRTDGAGPPLGRPALGFYNGPPLPGVRGRPRPGAARAGGVGLHGHAPRRRGRSGLALAVLSPVTGSAHLPRALSADRPPPAPARRRARLEPGRPAC